MKKMPKVPDFVSELGIFLLKSMGWIVIGVFVVFISSYFIQIPSNRVEVFSLIEILFGIVITALTISASFIVSFQWNVLESNRKEIENMTKALQKDIQSSEENLKNVQKDTQALQQKMDADIAILQVKTNQTIDDVKKKLESTMENLERTSEERFQAISTRLENESQTFMEVSYNFVQGSNAYYLGDDIHALQYFLRALQLQPNNTRILERVGRIYANFNDISNALSYLEKAITLESSNLEVLRSLARCYRYIDTDKAIDFLKKALLINTSSYETWNLLGLIYLDQEKYDEAIPCHERALELKNQPQTKSHLSVLFALKGDMQSAKDMAKAADYEKDKGENNLILRPVWKLHIHLISLIIDDKKKEALETLQAISEYMITKRVYEAVRTDVSHLLLATNHVDWMSEFMDLIKLKVA